MLGELQWIAATKGNARLADPARLVADRARLIGFHLPYPGIGHVEAAGAGYRFLATG